MNLDPSIQRINRQPGAGRAAVAQSVNTQIPVIVPAQTALVVMHYQTDILGLFPSVAPTLLADTRIPQI